MEKANKFVQYVRPGVGRPSEDDRVDSAGTAPEHPPTPDIPQPSVDEVAKDRWFLEQRGNRRVPKRLNITNEIMVTSQGPVHLKGNITLIDEDGTESFHNDLRLCRCGATKSGPVCDESHIEIEFFDNGAIHHASETLSSQQPQNLRVKAIKDGPLKLFGYVRLHNSRGQECLTRATALCRCGRSSKKPFCDCQ